MALKALLVGINEYATLPLRGCVNDALATAALLKQQYGLADDQLRLLTDAQATRQAITAGLQWLAEPDADGTAALRMFQFAGHGTQQADSNGDEPDGADECLMPFDYQTAGLMNDDELQRLYQGLPGTPHMLLLMDCCHSGNIHKDPFAAAPKDPDPRDIRQRFVPVPPEEYLRIINAKRQFRERKNELVTAQLREITNREIPEAELQRVAEKIGALVGKQHFGSQETAAELVVFSACRPEQTAADARFGEQYHGAFTFFLALALRNNASITYGELNEQLVKALADNKFAQVPQLDCSSANLTRPFLHV